MRPSWSAAAVLCVTMASATALLARQVENGDAFRDRLDRFREGTGTARYTNYRQFRSATRVVPPVQP